MAEKKYVYAFEEAYGLGKELLGGKGAGLPQLKKSKRKPEKHSVATTTHF